MTTTRQAVREDEPSLSRAAFGAVFAVMLTSAIGNVGLISVMPAIGREIGIADYLIASVFSLSALVWAVASPYWAKVSDAKGRKPLILLGMWGFIGSMIGCGAIVLAGLNSLVAPLAVFVAFLLTRSAYGLLGSASATAGQAYVADRTHGARRVKALSTLSGAINLGGILGPAIAPFLILGFLGLSGPMFIFGAGATVVLLMANRLIPCDLPVASAVVCTGGETPRIKGLWREPNVRPFLWYGLIVSSMQAINTYTLGFLIIDRMRLEPLEAQFFIGQAMVAGAVAGLVAQWGLVGFLGMSPKTMLRWGALLPCIGNLLIASQESFTWLLLAFSLASLGYGLARPGFAAAASLKADQRRQGAVAGAVSSIAGASIVVPPVVAIALYQVLPTAPFWAAGAALGGVFLYSMSTSAFKEIIPIRSANVS